MALTLSSTDNFLFPLATSEEASLAQEWDFFSGLASGRWSTDSDAHTVPFTAEQLDRFFSVARECVPDYHQDLESVCSYFGPKSSKWLLYVSIPQDAPLELLRRVGAAECQLSCGDKMLRAYIPDSLDRDFVDKHAVAGALLRVGRFTSKEQLSDLQFKTAFYSAAMRVCKEVGDEYYEAYFAITAQRAGSLPLATYDHVKTLLRYHYEEAKKHYSKTIKLYTTTTEDDKDGLLAWSANRFVPPWGYGKLIFLRHRLRDDIAGTLTALLGKDPQNDKHITEWLGYHQRQW